MMNNTANSGPCPSGPVRVNQVAEGSNAFSCSCGSSFKTKRGLTNHQSRFCALRRIEKEQAQQDVVTQVAQELPFKCSCGRNFKTKIGLGVHRRNKHTEEYFAEQPTERKNERWSTQELHLLAMQEVEIAASGRRDINDALWEKSTSRTKESIKGKRRDPEYKAIVDHLQTIECGSESEGNEVFDAEPETALEPDSESSEFFQQWIASTKQEEIPAELLLALVNEKDTVFSVIDHWISEKFPIKEPKVRKVCEVDLSTKKKRRRAHYSFTQSLYKKNRNRCLQTILGGAIDRDIKGPKPVDTKTIEFWKDIFESESIRDNRVVFWKNK